MQGRTVQCDNHLAFVQHKYQGEYKKVTKTYKNITYYKCDQLGHFIGSCPFKEDEQEKLKEKGSNLDNIIQGVNCGMEGMSSMHVEHVVDESNRETE